MGSNAVADLPGNQFPFVVPVLASRASNAADAVIPLGGTNQAMQVLAAYIVPQTSQVGSATNYADVKIVAVGADGTVAATLATKSFSAAGTSVAANARGAFTLGATPTKTAAQSLGLSYASQGSGVALVAHGLEVNVRYL